VGEAVLSVRRILALALALLGLAASARAEGEIVRRLSVRSDRPVDRTELESLIAIRVGEPLEEEQVRRTIRSLRLSGLAGEVELLRRPLDDGIEAILVLRPDLRVESVDIVGETGLDSRRLKSSVEQKVGQPLREDRLLRGVYALSDRLEREGFLDPRVRLGVDVDEAAGRARVTYRVESGARTRIGRVEIEGLPAGTSTEDASKALEASSGTPYRRAVARDDAERLQRYLIHAGYRLATVEGGEPVAGAEADTVDLTWEVAPGPRVDVQVIGAELKKLERRDLLPFLGDAGFDEALLQQSVELIKRSFQERGYYDVAVEATQRRSEQRLAIRIEIVPGLRSTLEEIDFDGNEAVPDDQLARRMSTAPRRLLTPGSGRLVDEELAEDLSNLRSFYALAGYDRARVGPPRVERLPSGLRLVVPVEEGPRRSVAELEIEGLEALDAEALRPELPLRAGGPFHRLLLESSAEWIRSRLEQRGYRSAIVSPEVEWNDGKTVARVRLRVLEGERSTAEAILVRGNTRTSTAVIRRFLELDPGDPISTGALLDVQRRLYRLGVFSSVSVTTPTAVGGAADREVLVEVEEGKTIALSYGAGYDSENGARGLLRASQANLFGRLISLQADALVSQKDQVYRILGRQPYLGRWPVEVSALGFREAESRPSFDVSRRGLQLGLQRSYGWGRAGLFYGYRIVELETDEPDEVVPRESRSARVASLTPTLLLDRRDDPIEPHRGWSAQLQIERAFPLLAADAAYRKLFAQGTGYLPLRGLGELAFSLRGGAIDPLAEAKEPGLEPIDAVPAAELFYAGGRTSHRAFERDLLGIPGETLFVEPGKKPVAVGGGGLALVNLEWRFPIAGALGGTAFVDGGNVWRRAGDIDPAELRWGAGVGIRYLSPIGPLRFEIGWKLDRESYEDPYVWYFSLGNPF